MTKVVSLIKLIKWAKRWVQYEYKILGRKNRTNWVSKVEKDVFFYDILYSLSNCTFAQILLNRLALIYVVFLKIYWIVTYIRPIFFTWRGRILLFRIVSNFTHANIILFQKWHFSCHSNGILSWLMWALAFFFLWGFKPVRKWRTFSWYLCFFYYRKSKNAS